jgi:hypothetical protein
MRTTYTAWALYLVYRGFAEGYDGSDPTIYIYEYKADFFFTYPEIFRLISQRVLYPW